MFFGRHGLWVEVARNSLDVLPLDPATVLSMKVALVSPYDFLYPGGVNSHVAGLAAALRERGLIVYVIAQFPAGRPAPPHTLSLGGRLTRLPSGGVQARISLSPALVWRTRQLLVEHRFDLVHLHNPLTPLGSVGFLYHRRAAPQTTFVATFHEYRHNANPAIEAGKPLFRRWLNRLDARIAVSEAAAEFNQRHFPGRYTVIPNGVDVARFTPPAPSAPVDRPPTILFVGRLETRKGIACLLDAFQRVRSALPAARLRLVGPGVLPPGPQPAGVEVLGQVSDAALPACYHSADVFCAPSIGYESFGIVLLEAMAAGVPIVASDLPGYRQTLQHGRQGVLVPPGDPAALAEALTALLQQPARRRALGAAGPARARQFDWGRVAEAVLQLYARAQQARAARPC